MSRGAVWGRLYFENMKSHVISTYFKFVKKSQKMPETCRRPFDRREKT